MHHNDLQVDHPENFVSYTIIIFREELGIGNLLLRLFIGGLEQVKVVVFSAHILKSRPLIWQFSRD